MAKSSHVSALSVLAAGLLVAALAAGCGSERRYCDATGCYYCDGLGCRPAGSPGSTGDAGPVADSGTPGDAGTPQACTSDNDCASGFRCSAGQCRATADLCQFNSECGNGRTCVDGRCLDPCASASDCPDPATQTCSSSGFCACQTASCTLDDLPHPFCTSDAQCQPGHPCVGGICRTPCQTASDCQRYDVQFNYCLGGYCATTNEVTSNCALSSDCTGTQQCVDGVCQ